MGMLLHLTDPSPLMRLPIPILFAFLAPLSSVPATYGQQSCQETKRHVRTASQKGGGSGLWPMDLLHQRIELDLTLGNEIAGACTITAVPRSDGQEIFPLHLEALTVDSVTGPTGPMTFSHTGVQLDIALAAPLNTTDTIELTVYYHGDPITDPSGFGGFYTGQYTYNLGVAFQSVPHSYGRVWFPCVDNFTERNSYEFRVRTAVGSNAWCNGELIDEETLGDGTLRRHWRMQETIPAYLAAVAAADYTVARDTFPSIGGGAIPVDLVARAPDTTGMKSSFVNLQQAFDHFEAWFGAYRWNRVGYVLTTQGAMEHSTSIHYPRSIAGGNLQYENVMAHELAHQWFGDLVTCDRAEEMYINEGGAEYLSYLFLEAVYGPERYRSTVRSNHRRMVHRAHLDDEGWWALSEVPQEWTYGEHSYNKGADVLHSLRGYLGDALFIEGFTSFLDAHAFQPVNSTQMRDHLSQATGTDLIDFFNDWVMQPGWAAFEVDSFEVSGPTGGTWPTTVYVEQKQRGPSTPYQQVPLTVTCLAADGTPWYAPQPMLASGTHSSFVVAPPFTPVAVLLNTDERLSLAITVDNDTLGSNTIVTYSSSDIRLQAFDLDAPLPVIVQEYWVPADERTDEPFAYRVSPDRYWRIAGAFPEGAVSGRINFDGRPNLLSALDVGLMEDAGSTTFHEDSLVLLYRPDGRWPWSRHSDFTVNTLGDATNKFGRIDFNDVRGGEYTLAWRISPVGIAEPALPRTWSIGPNPSTEQAVIATDTPFAGTIELLDATGRCALTMPMRGNRTTVQLQALRAGTYRVRATTDGRSTTVGSIVVGD